MKASRFQYPKPVKSLPLKNFRDLINLFRQDIKYKFVPFKLYYKYRAHKYAKKSSPELNLIKYFCEKQKISLDVGANLGLFTYFLQKYSHEVFAFEPNPYPLRYLYSLVGNNTSILPIAVGSRDQTIELNIPKNRKGWSSNGASLKKIDINSGIKLKVICRKIDSLSFENVGLIKIDVEGFEIDVLKGAVRTINEQKPNMIIENEIIHQKNPMELLKLIIGFGYQVYFPTVNIKLKKIDNNFDFNIAQKNPELKNTTYLQNFICIHRDNIAKYNDLIE